MLETQVEESEARPQPGFEPSMNRHRPASEKTQEISHLLASIFTDVYTTEIIGKDTVANLTQTRRGGSTYHDRYVEELQQVHAEHSRRLRSADLLEEHIVRARVQATATESQAHRTLVEELGEAYQQLGLPPVRSTFMWCVDNGLLKSNSLICPQDYITEPAPLVKAPPSKSTPGFVNPTLAYNQHVSQQPQDDGYTLIPPPDRTSRGLLEESEGSLTLASSSDASLHRTTPPPEGRRAGRPQWMEEPSAQSRAEERLALHKLKERHNFLRNPRFLPPDAHRGNKSLLLPGKNVAPGVNAAVEESTRSEAVPVFLANPAVIYFTDYIVGHVYETTVELRNMTSASRQVRVLPPTTPHFSTGLGRFPGEGGVIAPGMSCQYMVRFAPDSLADYEDFLLVETQAQCTLLVPIKAHRAPPILTLPSVLDCGYCLVGGVRFVEFLCHNKGLSAGTFCIIPKSKWLASNLRAAVTAGFAEQAPFAVRPSLFELQPGQATLLEVVFFPTTAESCSQVFTVVCDNCQLKDITIQGEGQLMALELVCVSEGDQRPTLGEVCDLTAEHLVRFGPANPHSVQQQRLVIRNHTHLELPFHWTIVKPNLRPLFSGKTPDLSCIQHHLATDLVFNVSPPSGCLAPLQDHDFQLSYSPQELKDYHSVCHLVMQDIPDLPRDPNEDGAPQTLDTTLSVNDVIAMEIEVKGSSEPYQVLLEPYAIHILGELWIGTAVHRGFKMWNNSKSPIRFQWERISDCHIMEVLPSSGEIEINECFDLELVVDGGRPGTVVTSLQCHVQHHHKPVVLAVEVTFKGPQLSLSVPSVDLGLVRLGESARSMLLLTNTSQLPARWTCSLPHTDTQISVEPSCGVLGPLASCSVEVLLRPEVCQHFETVLDLAVENGSGCQLSVQAEVQSPQVCLLSCALVFSELYVGVPAKGTVTMFNQTLLPTLFTWSQFQLQGKHASLCSATFSPSSGTLGPNAKMEVTVAFTAHTDIELSEAAAVCQVEGMNEPLVLGFFCQAKGLRVSYSLPCPASDDQGTSPFVLNFGDDVVLGSTVNKQLVITNHTPIPAPFTITAEYFIGHAPLQRAGQSQTKASHMRRPLHSVQAKKVEEKEHEEFVNGLLAHGRGAAIFLQPDSGTLGAFESQTVHITAFTDMWGEYRDLLISKVGDLPPKAIPTQMTVRGCPLYFQLTGPQPDNQNQGPIIRFGTHVSGGDTVSRCLRLNNTSPYDIRVDWQSYNLQQGDRKLLDLVVAYGTAFPLRDADGNELVGGALAASPQDGPRSPSSDGASSSEEEEEEEEVPVCEEDETGEGAELRDTPAQENKLFSVVLRPHEGNASDYPYCITPQQIVVPAGGSSTIHVSFTPLSLSEPCRDPSCTGFALGFMSLDSQMACCVPGKVQRAQGWELEPLRLDLQALVRPAVLLVQMEEEEEEVLRFSAVASDLLQGEPGTQIAVQEEFAVTRTFQLRNTSEMPLSFRLSAKAPFSVLPPQTKSQAQPRSRLPSRPASYQGPPAGDQLLVLQPRHNMQVRVAFHSSVSLLAYQSQPAEEAPPPISSPADQCGPTEVVSLVHGEGGARTLRFQQNLKVVYSNNSSQMVPLCCDLALPSLRLSCAGLDFGPCFVGQTQVREVLLYNHGASSSYWTTHIDSGEEGCGVFRVTPDSGILKPWESPVSSCSQALQISFTARDEESRATVIIQGVLGERSLSLQLHGQGSYDQRHGSPTAQP